MGRLVVSNIVSLDGFYEGPGKDVMALPMDDAFDVFNANCLKSATTLLLGRLSYKLFSGYWPAVADDPNTTSIQKDVSRLMNRVDKLVVSDSMEASSSELWHSTRVIRRADVARAVAKIKQEKSGNILVFGSHTMWSGLLRESLIDEFHFMIAPVVLGEGTRLFDDRIHHSFRLLDGPESFPGSDNVVLRYLLANA